jgi:RNA polymerase sigma-70 factor (ECF subfamily)
MNRNTENKNTIIEQCLISLAENKLEAMDRLYETISKDVYAFAISKVRDKFDAEDITQDTFIRVYENAKLYTPIGKPLAWIFTIETNVINRYFNLKNRNNNIEDESILEQVEDSSNIDESKEIKNDYLRKLLLNLSEIEREIISLHLVSDLKFREIAKLLNKPLSTILSKYNRAIKKLKQIVKEENYEKESN